MKPMISSVPRTSSTIALTDAMTVPSPILSKKNECSTDGASNCAAVLGGQQDL